MGRREGNRAGGSVAWGSLVALCLVNWLAAPGLVGKILVEDEPVGEWSVTVEWPDGAREARMSVTRVEGALKVSWNGPRGGLPCRDPEWDPPVLSFAMDAASSSGPVVLKFAGRVDGDHLEGAITTPSGANLPLKGRRQPRGPSEAAGR